MWQNAISKNWNKNYKPKKLLNGEPIYLVATDYLDNTSFKFYVVSNFEQYGSNKCLLIALQKEERYSIHIDRKNNSYSLAICDYF